MSASLAHPRWTYTRGLHDLGNGAYAWLQPDGGWGWSNAGLIVDGEDSLLVDTLFDLPLTRDMLAAMKKAEPRAAASIGTLASRAAADEMATDSPERLAAMMRSAPDMGQVGRWFRQAFGAFDFEGITQSLPTHTFEDRLELRVGEKRLELTTVGPAHTKGDILVHVPEDRTVFTGDILFVGGHPIVWEGPVANWIEACRRIEAMDVETVVPGHGPITEKRAATVLREYFEHVWAETRKRYEAGLDAFEAAKDLELTDYDAWGDRERIVVNVAEIYRELDGAGSEEGSILDRGTLFARMAEMAGA